MVVIFLGFLLIGLNYGVKWLSNLNILLGVILFIFILIFGDLKFILELYILVIFDYL